jgi:hypothetical protein
VWTFTLRENPQFGSGRPISVFDVAATLAPAAGPKVPGIDSTRVLSDRELRVFGSRDLDSAMHFLAAPAMAMVDGRAREDSGPVASLERPARGNLPAIQVRLRTQADARDALDRGADLIVSRDPELIEYAQGRPEFVTFPLPWSRTYVLLQTASAAPLDVVNTEGQRRSLATEAVHADARAAEPPFWWNKASDCPGAAPASAARAPVSDRIGYPSGDPVARALAERLVGLIQSGTSLRTAPLDDGTLETALRDGTERAYVLGLPRQTMAPCGELAVIPGGARIRPLIDSRAHAIVRRGAPPLIIDWDASVRVEEP